MNSLIKKQREVLAAATPGPWKTRQSAPHGPTEIRGSGINCWVCNVGSANTAKAMVAAMNQREAMIDLVEKVQEMAESKELQGVFSFAAAHGVKYTGPDFGKELAAVIAAMENE